jgi:hypothetical protein
MARDSASGTRFAAKTAWKRLRLASLPRSIDRQLTMEWMSKKSRALAVGCARGV